MKIIRCLNCNKVLGEVEGKAKIKCKMAGCHCMNVIDTDEGTHVKEALAKSLSFDESVEEYKRIHKDENDTAQRIMQANVDLLNGDWKKHFRPFEIK